ncbi:hypothetical protein CTI14_02755 [Methylobacterium radiotolerans]|nr:hypothetical protein CTI14_02755 [Methylobacterium radiotolerans]
MSYTQIINRAHPSAFVFIVDQSGSMSERWGAGNMSKAEQVATIINRQLFNLSIRCTKGEGVRDYFDVAVIGYGKSVEPILGGNLAGRGLVPVSDIAQHPLRVEDRTKKIDDGAGGLIEQKVRFPVWLDATANGGTPMCKALEYARTLLEPWVAQHPESHPPVVLHITDGQSTDGDPVPGAQALTDLRTNDGQVLLFNAHISADAGIPVEFPETDATLADVYSRTLFAMSSVLPHGILVAANHAGHPVGDGSRGFVYNADSANLISFLDIGTSTASAMEADR